jgi:hypothetical protein
MSNVLGDTTRQQILALGRLGWTLSHIQQSTGVRRETVSVYLKAAGIPVRGRGRPSESRAKLIARSLRLRILTADAAGSGCPPAASTPGIGKGSIYPFRGACSRTPSHVSVVGPSSRATDPRAGTVATDAGPSDERQGHDHRRGRPAGPHKWRPRHALAASRVRDGPTQRGGVLQRRETGGVRQDRGSLIIQEEPAGSGRCRDGRRRLRRRRAGTANASAGLQDFMALRSTVRHAAAVPRFLPPPT